MIQVTELVKTIDNNRILDGLTLHVPDSSMYGLVGPAGAGKSLALEMIMGLSVPDSGTVMINDMEAGSQVRRLIRRIGYVPDGTTVYPRMKVIEYMDFFADCYDLHDVKTKRRIRMLLEMVGLSEKENQLMETLAPAQLQKLAIARALIHDPRILVLDAPMRGMDMASKYSYRQILEETAERGKTILISSRNLSDISEICSDIGIIDHGKMVMEGRLRDVLRQINSSNPIVISVEGNLPHAMKALKADKKVRSISIQNKDILITYAGSEQEETALLGSLVSAGIPVRSFHRETGNMEQVFKQLTGEKKERRISGYET